MHKFRNVVIHRNVDLLMFGNKNKIIYELRIVSNYYSIRHCPSLRSHTTKHRSHLIVVNSSVVKSKYFLLSYVCDPHIPFFISIPYLSYSFIYPHEQFPYNNQSTRVVSVIICHSSFVIPTTTISITISIHNTILYCTYYINTVRIRP